MPERETPGVWNTSFLNINTIVGTSVFVLIGITAGLAGPAMILSFPAAALVAFITALSSAELSTFITEPKGPFVHIDHAFGQFWAFIVGWTQSFDYILGACVGAIGFTAYFVRLLGFSPTVTVLILIGGIWPLILVFAQIRGLTLTIFHAIPLLALKLAGLTLFIGVGGYFLLIQGDYSNYFPFAPLSTVGILNGASMNFYAFAGFSTILLFARGMRSPSRNIPKTLGISIGVSTLLYIGVALVSIGLVNWRILQFTRAPLQVAMAAATNDVYLLGFVAITALVATSAVILSSLFVGSRVLSAMADERAVPEVLGTRSDRGVPVYAVVLIGILVSAIVIVSKGDLILLATMFNFGTLMAYLFINLSVLHLRRKEPHAERLYKVPFYPWIPLAGVAGCLTLTLRLNRTAILAIGAWILIGVLAYALYKRYIRRSYTKNLKA
ncbi:MAG TPA: amino acid permease [Methanomicrobiales archaeon]|nr:amino acid permease [Methanomicrobiales archaeon]